MLNANSAHMDNPNDLVLNLAIVHHVYSDSHPGLIHSQSANMPWYTGQEVINLKKEKIQVHTLLDALNLFVIVPERKVDAPLRLPISGAYKIKGVGDVLAGRVEQGIVKPGDEVIFLPTHTAANPCNGKVFTVEMHHKRVDKAGPGDNVGLNIKVHSCA